jgi:hypothetical protein
MTLKPAAVPALSRKCCLKDGCGWVTSARGTPPAFPLFERAGNAAERRVEVGADRIDGDDDGNRDAGCDQTVFNRRGSGLIPQKSNEMLIQVRLLALSSPLGVATLRVRSSIWVNSSATFHGNYMTRRCWSCAPNAATSGLRRRKPVRFYRRETKPFSSFAGERD